ncbi:MAG: ABC transporter ATP-binding protein [Gammaproteobacteria bacterium]
MPNEPIVQARGLVRRYPAADRTVAVLAGVDLDIHAGECVVIIGRSGSGKSTLLNLLGAMDRPDAGTLRVAGVDLHVLDEEARTAFRRRHVGFVFQSFNLIPTLTVAENLRLPLELNGMREGAGARVQECLESLALADKAGRFPDQLSGGEQQRVAIARALIHRPALVIADEPTGNLDIDTGRQVIALLDTLTRGAGHTLVMATHSREVIGIADRLVSIAGGALVEAPR